MKIYQKNHPHNAVFVAQLQSVIDGVPRVVQVGNLSEGDWGEIENDEYGTPNTSWSNTLAYRLKPVTVTRTLTYPEPLRVAPAVGTVVWILNPSCPKGFSTATWAGYSCGEIYLRRGFIFATESDAAEAARAIFGGEL